jgi:copper(I)-binding protein
MAKTRMSPFSCLAMAAALLALAGCHGGTPQAGVSVEHVWVRLPAVPGGAGAGYFTATAPADDALLGVTAGGARIELHESMTAGGMTSMRPLRTVALGAGDEVRFAPAGKHLMIFGLDPGLKKGGTLPLTFRFRASPPVTATARLVGAGDAPPEDAEG